MNYENKLVMGPYYHFLETTKLNETIVAKKRIITFINVFIGFNFATIQNGYYQVVQIVAP
jgi:hypothetical protein